MSYSKYKDSLPEETLNQIKSILSTINISMNHILKKRFDGIYSAIVYDANNRWSTGGKGTTEEYCLASGYAEAIEHLCNYCAYDYRSANSKSQEFGGFLRYPDEMRVSVYNAITINNAIFEDIKQSFVNDGSMFSVESCEQCWKELLKSEVATIAPFFSVKTNDIVFLPDEIVGRLSGSTGGGAGNTPYEALSHAFDEISERYVKYQIYSRKLTPPIIPRAFIKDNCNELYNIICQLEEKGYNVIVKDASLGESFPVVSVALINPKEQGYMIKFGAHCSFPIALERCLTEMFQSFSLDAEGGNGHKTFHIMSQTDDWKSSLEGTWFNQLKDDTGAVPFNYFFGTPSWSFQPWGGNIDYSNKYSVRFHVDNFQRIGCKDIFIRDLSFLGFPVYKVYIPEFSFSHLSINQKVIHSFLIVKEVIDEIIQNRVNDVEEYRQILIDCFCMSSYVGCMLLKNVEESLIELCYAALLYEKDGNNSFLSQLSKYNKYAKSILFDIELERRGHTKEERIRFLNTFFDRKTSDIICCWHKRNIFVNLIRYLLKADNAESTSITWGKYDVQSISDTHERFKKTMLKSIPDQIKTKGLLEPCCQ